MKSFILIILGICLIILFLVEAVYLFLGLPVYFLINDFIFERDIEKILMHGFIFYFDAGLIGIIGKELENKKGEQ